MNDIKKIDEYSLDNEKDARERLKKVFPECIVEDKLDIDKLLTMCGEYITDDFEHYEFKWSGKSECMQIAQRRTNATLRPYPKESIDFDNTKNLYIEGDNLEVIKILQKSYYRKIKMIYIDPPYNTGHDFVYEDDFSDPIERYKEVTSQATKSNPETMGRFHTRWLNMMYPRLTLAQKLLRDDGVCFISIDDTEVANLRKLCDEAFGEENFIAQITWKKRGGPPNDKIIGAVHEFILAYAKNIDLVQLYRKERTGKQLERYKNPDNHPKGMWAADNLMANVKGGRYVESLYYPIINPITGEEHYPTSHGNWRFNKEKMQQLLDNNEIYFGENNNGRPKLKRFLCDVKNGVPFSTLFDDVGYNNRATKEMESLIGNVNIFDTPKPTSLILSLLKLAAGKDDIILDFFSGSATTAHAVMQLNAEDGGNRQFIMVQLPEPCKETSEAYKAGYRNICDIGKTRILKAGLKIQQEIEEQNKQMKLDEQERKCPDIGFKVLKLDNTNFLKWSPYDENQAQLNITEQNNHHTEFIKRDRYDLDFVYEIMLKMGIPLDYKVIPIKHQDKTFYSIGEECLVLICIEKGLTFEIIEEMVKRYCPGYFIFNEQEDDSLLKNVKMLLDRLEIIMELI